MKFYDTSNEHNSLGHYVLYLLGGITTTDFPLADLARATNAAKYNLALKVLERNDAWDWDDEGYDTTFHIATATLVDGQRDYTVPTDALKLDRVELKDGAGNYYGIDIIDQRDVINRTALTDYGESNGKPYRCWVTKRSMILDPAPDVTNGAVTASAGIRVYYPREINEFDATTTTTDVGMGNEGDAIIAYAVAEEYARIRRPDKLEIIQQGRLEMENAFLDHVSHRVRQQRTNLSVGFESAE